MTSTAPAPAAPRPPYDKDLLEAIHVLAAELRHELGNPLNSIKAALTLVRRGIDTYPREKTLSYLDATLSEVARLERLLHSLRRIAEPASQPPAPFDIAAFLEGFLAHYSYEVERRGIILATAPAAAARVAVDSGALGEVLLDLLNNAVQRLGRVEEPRLKIVTRGLGASYAIELRSNGRAAEAGAELPFATSMLGPREEHARLSLAISRQILLQQGAVVINEQAAPEAWVARLEMPAGGAPAGPS